jgi:hypothetical protein
MLLLNGIMLAACLVLFRYALGKPFVRENKKTKRARGGGIIVDFSDLTQTAR